MNDLLHISANGLEINEEISLSTLGGRLFGPTLLDVSNSLIICSISLESVGLMMNLFVLSLFRYCLKCLLP